MAEAVKEEVKEEKSEVEIVVPEEPKDPRSTKQEMIDSGVHPEEITMAEKQDMIKPEETDDAGEKVQVQEDKGKEETGEKGESETEEDKFKADKFILGSKMSIKDSNLFENNFTPLLIKEKTNKTCTLPVMENQ